MEFGIEREMLVYNDDLSECNFRRSELTDKVTVDFFDNQIELITSVHKNYHDVLFELEDLINSKQIINKKIWPLSQAGFLGENLSYNSKDYDYRDYLIKKYSKEYMSISGIHCNLSFIENKSEEKYFELMKKLIYFSPIIVQFFSFTPFYEKNINTEGLHLINKNYGYENSISLRNSYEHGYLNENQFNIDYSTVDGFKSSIAELIKDGKIRNKSEIYSKVRLKKSKKNYLELRFIDINPYNRLGIKPDQLILLEKILSFVDLLNMDITNNMISEAHQMFEKVCLNGKDKQIKLYNNQSLNDSTIDFLDKIIDNLNLNEIELYVINKVKKDYINNNMDIDKMIKEIKNEKLSIKEFGIKHIYQKEQFKELFNGNKMELSTKILMNKAMEKGYGIEIIDEDSSAMNISDGNNIQTVIQATKTNMDTYANIVLMENKILSKKILEKNKIKIANSQNFFKGQNIDLKSFQNRKIVIKPHDTNFGKGITIIEKNSSEKVIQAAVDYAFEFSDRILIEDFFTGVEYRFLVINSKVIGIIQRIPANVVGDGKHSIEELVEIKNLDPIRSKGYVTPVELVDIGLIEMDFLSNCGLNKDSIPNKGEVIFLRENSNVSTGGDTKEVFNLMNSYFKNIAIEATKAFNVKICGIDMIINKDFDDYIIVEANFNPAIQMHTYPVYGIGRNPADSILKLLFKY